mmetsp:Transcript_1793/g.5091  ORF Transcript_1793/g.5091 Transcript_1793/m.5091 type:complete len:491 (+) Transcript_1793:240-1712(+)
MCQVQLRRRSQRTHGCRLTPGLSSAVPQISSSYCRQQPSDAAATAPPMSSPPPTPAATCAPTRFALRSSSSARASAQAARTAGESRVGGAGWPSKALTGTCAAHRASGKASGTAPSAQTIGSAAGVTTPRRRGGAISQIGRGASTDMLSVAGFTVAGAVALEESKSTVAVAPALEESKSAAAHTAGAPGASAAADVASPCRIEVSLASISKSATLTGSGVEPCSRSLSAARRSSLARNASRTSWKQRPPRPPGKVVLASFMPLTCAGSMGSIKQRNSCVRVSSARKGREVDGWADIKSASWSSRQPVSEKATGAAAPCTCAGSPAASGSDARADASGVVVRAVSSGTNRCRSRSNEMRQRRKAPLIRASTVASACMAAASCLGRDRMVNPRVSERCGVAATTASSVPASRETPSASGSEVCWGEEAAGRPNGAAVAGVSRGSSASRTALSASTSWISSRGGNGGRRASGPTSSPESRSSKAISAGSGEGR